MSPSSSSPSSTPTITTPTTTNVFDVGKYTTLLLSAEPNTCTTKSSLSLPPPKPLLIATPDAAGEFPLLLLLHGYLLYNSFYSQLIRHIASHGFIVIAPQLYTVAGPDSTDEIKSAAAITDWLPSGLHKVLPTHVQPNLTKIGLSGHSRGGKAAFALALGKVTTPSLKFSALIGIDPVDGMDKGKQTPPPVLTYIPHSFNLDMAVLVIGSGLGEVKKNPLFPPCAPKGINHEDFYKECCEPACYFVAKDYGHVDMLDDETKGIRGKTSYCLCKNGKSREPMRRFVGGVMVAFMKAYLEACGRATERYRHSPPPPATVASATVKVCIKLTPSRGYLEIDNVSKLVGLDLCFLGDEDVFDYLEQSAACNQTRERITEFLEKCKKYNLAKAEILNIVNIRPSSVVEIDPIIEECESRLGDSVEELVELVAEVLPAPPTQTESDNAGVEDKQEIPDGQQMDTS
ncbi:hypothetical protein TEA_007304 [Camellia sinensis var. sinensis]|uniref:chlorophyllase n=1 Tax=Camellia sinensis var. sinensis TaxID=542762 RepID=A0A4S4D4Z6_CAMSN|nr:hypothetical protein TEA_007304 [Camellia sinensis var. sinensis]